MASSAIFFFALSLSFSLPVFADDPRVICPVKSCRLGKPEIRFPFRLRDVQTERCGYAGFDLSCNNRSQAILRLPNSQDFVVDNINYEQQYAVLKDPGNCLAKLLEKLKFSSSPFVAQGSRSFMFADCPAESLPGFRIRPVDCLSDEHRKVLLTDANDPRGPYFSKLGCRTWIATVRASRQYPTDVTESVTLRWDQPDCRSCEESGWRCGLNGSTGSRVGCFSKPGLSKSVILTAVMVPLLLCMLGIACYLCSRARAPRHHSRRGQTPINNDGESDVADTSFPLSPRRETQRTSYDSTGLSSLTIESYPKIQVGEDGQVSRPNDDICSICLSEYQARETLRTIPECGHYFHVQCIDQWLRQNASCPMCRS